MECSGIWHSGASSSNGEICDVSRGRGEIGRWGDGEEGRRARKWEEEEESGRKGREDGGEEEEDGESEQLATKC